MRIDVLYFAVLRERAGTECEALHLEAGSTVEAARRVVAARRPELAALLPRVQAAVNRQVAGGAHVLADGDELAFIPPVAGGSGGGGDGRRVAVVATPLDLREAMACVEAPGRGAITTFTGTVRSAGQLAEVTRLEYEAYAPMAEDVLRAIADEIEREWPGARVAIHHRVGSLAVGDAAVVIAVGAPHRAAAFEACRAAIERLKQRAPIWKKEFGPDGAVWVGMGP